MTHTNDVQTVHTCQTRSVCKPRPPAYIQGPACIQGTASISTITSDPWPEFEARLVFKARLLFEEIRYMFTYITTMDNTCTYMPCIWSRTWRWEVLCPPPLYRCKNSSGDEIVNVNFLRRQRTCRGQRLSDFLICTFEYQLHYIMLWARSWFSNVLAANHLCTYAHQTESSDFVLPK